MTVSAVCFILALVFFLLVAFSAPSPPQVNWLGLGLSFLTLAFLLGGVALRI